MKELDVVLLKDGRKATVLEVYSGGTELLVEISDKSGKTLETPVVRSEDVSKALYIA